MCAVAVIVVGSIGWLVFIAMLGVLIYYRRYVLSVFFSAKLAVKRYCNTQYRISRIDCCSTSTRHRSNGILSFLTGAYSVFQVRGRGVRDSGGRKSPRFLSPSGVQVVGLGTNPQSLKHFWYVSMKFLFSAMREILGPMCSMHFCDVNYSALDLGLLFAAFKGAAGAGSPPPPFPPLDMLCWYLYHYIVLLYRFVHVGQASSTGPVVHFSFLCFGLLGVPVSRDAQRFCDPVPANHYYCH